MLPASLLLPSIHPERRKRIIESVRRDIYRFVALLVTALVLSVPARTGTSREGGGGGRNRKKKIKINRYRNPISVY